jgi:hypothetical protein
MVDEQEIRSLWYTLVQSEKALEQGDFLNDFPIPIPPDDIYDLGMKEKGIQAKYLVATFDLIVMTQSCDFQKMGDSESVILCPHEAFLDASKDRSNKNQLWDQLIREQVISQHILNKCDIENYKFEYQVVNLRDVYSVPYGYVKKVASRIPYRVRLLSPYKEHLSQAFARQFMRVGLPLDIPRSYPY